MTVLVWIEVFTLNNGFETVATSQDDSGQTPTWFFTHFVTGRVCIQGATVMKTVAVGWWVNSHGVKKGTNSDESIPVPVPCAEI